LRDSGAPHWASAGEGAGVLFQEIRMKVNVGGADRVLRIVVGLFLILLVLSGQIGVWGWIGVVPLATGLFRICPLYTVLGMSTCPMAQK
jgi:hypothetical protein